MRTFFSPWLKTTLLPLKDADVFLTLRADMDFSFVREAKKRFPNLYFIPLENRGRDIRPFLHALQELKRLGYQYGCKLHFLRNRHIWLTGEKWRDAGFWSPILGGGQALARAKQAFWSNPKAGLLVPKGCVMSCEDPDSVVNNRGWLDQMLGQIGRQDLSGGYRFKFPSGSMYWFRMQALDGLALLQQNLGDFEDELGQIDGTLAHALERFVGLYCQAQGYEMREVNWAIEP